MNIMNWNTIFNSVVGLITFILGVIFTFFITKHYYQKASEELNNSRFMKQ